MLSHGTSLHSINFTSTSLNCEKWQNPRATAYIQHHLRQTGKTENKNHMIWQPGPNYRFNLIAIHWEKHSQGIIFLHKCPFSLSYNKSTVSVLDILVWTTSKLKVKVISQNALLTSFFIFKWRARNATILKLLNSMPYTNTQPKIYTVTDVSTREITVLYPWSQYDSGGWPVDMFQFARNLASCFVAERGSHKTEENKRKRAFISSHFYWCYKSNFSIRN